jgi:hypothetical protein
MMARIRYLLNSTLIWVFISGWAALVVWVIATAAPAPMGLLQAIAWPFFMVVLALPGIVAYVGWVRRRDEELERRRQADATVKLSISREELGRAKDNARGLNDEVAQKPQQLLAPPSSPSLDEASPGPAPTSLGPALGRERQGGNKFLDDFEKELWERTRSPPKARTSPGPPSEGKNKFLGDLEEEVRQILGAGSEG